VDTMVQAVYCCVLLLMLSERLWTRRFRLCIVVYCCCDIREIVDTMVQAVFCCCDIREIVDTMVQAYSQKIFNGQLPVFDGRRNLYSREPLPIGREKVSLQMHA